MIPVMSERARKLLQHAMELPLPERAELVADLLTSLDGEPASGVEAAWAAEIERRAREAIADLNDDIAWETVRAELERAEIEVSVDEGADDFECGDFEDARAFALRLTAAT